MTDVPRRAVLLGAAAAPLAAGCTPAANVPPPPPPTQGQVLTPAADVPVGEAKIVDGTLITQPTEGSFKGFIARCSHAGCALTIKSGRIQCPCHGSTFTLEGDVQRGPAVAPLTPRAITVKGSEIVAG